MYVGIFFLVVCPGQAVAVCGHHGGSAQLRCTSRRQPMDRYWKTNTNVTRVLNGGLHVVLTTISLRKTEIGYHCAVVVLYAG